MGTSLKVALKQVYWIIPLTCGNTIKVTFTEGIFILFNMHTEYLILVFYAYYTVKISWLKSFYIFTYY